MKRRVFYSFHYNDDFARVSQIRNIGMIQGNSTASSNDWEKRYLFSAASTDSTIVRSVLIRA